MDGRFSKRSACVDAFPTGHPLESRFDRSRAFTVTSVKKNRLCIVGKQAASHLDLFLLFVRVSVLAIRTLQ